MTLLDVRNLHVDFSRRIGVQLRPTVVRAVNGVDLQIAAGETLAIAGESGSGKSTLARAVMRLVAAQGSVRFDGVELLGLSERALRPIRPRLQIVFQDPYSSLNPMMSVADLLDEPLRFHSSLDSSARLRRAGELLELVELGRGYLQRYPDELSGGQRQRVALARAIACDPALLVLDEAVSALDVSTQNKIIGLLESLQAQLGMAYLFISHNLAVVEHIADRVAVMYLGQVVEQASAEQLFATPQHPYTKALLSAVPVPDPSVRVERIVLRGDIPSPAALPAGCSFHTRCPIAQDICRIEPPPLRVVEDHHVLCHFAGDASTAPVPIAEGD